MNANGRIEKIRDRVHRQAEAERMADGDPENEVAADAADDLLVAISDNAVLDVPFLLAEIDRLRAENAALAAALEDIAFIGEHTTGNWGAIAECLNYRYACHVEWPDDPESWCPVCVAEVAWCAWKVGVLGA